MVVGVVRSHPSKAPALNATMASCSPTIVSVHSSNGVDNSCSGNTHLKFGLVPSGGPRNSATATDNAVDTAAQLAGMANADSPDPTTVESHENKLFSPFRLLSHDNTSAWRMAACFEHVRSSDMCTTLGAFAVHFRSGLYSVVVAVVVAVVDTVLVAVVDTVLDRVVVTVVDVGATVGVSVGFDVGEIVGPIDGRGDG